MIANMILVASLITALLPLHVFAQTPSGFTPGAGASLGVLFTSSDTTVSPAGILIPKPDTVSPPELTAPTSGPISPTEVYMAIMIDTNVTYGTTQTTYLHWFQPNLVSSQNTTTPANMLLSNNDTSIADAPYVQPSPPTDGRPHEYVILLFAQPAEFAVPKAYADVIPPANETARLGFDFAAFIAAAKLDAPVAGNYFQVLNGTSAQTSSVTVSFPLATGTVTTTAASLTATTTASMASGAAGSSSASASATAAGGAGRAVKDFTVAGAMGVVGAVAWML